MKRVLIVHQYLPPGGYQDRQRGAMYSALFRQAGYDVEFAGRHPMPLLQDARAAAGRALERSLTVKAYGRARDRLVTAVSDKRILRMASAFDAIILIKVDSPAFVHALRIRTRARLIYDLSDSIWRGKRGETLTPVVEMLSAMDAITVDNSFGHEFAKRLGPPVHVWPSAAYIEKFDERRADSRRDTDHKIVLGWLGSHTTVSNLYLILESLEDVSRRHPNVEVRVLGIPPDHEILRRFERTRFTTLSMYTSAEMIDEVLGMDIGLYPMYDLDDSAMHGVTKGVIYMAGGAVVVASPIRDVAKIIIDGETGFTARGRDEWTRKLEQLTQDRALRDRLRKAALARVRREYSLEHCFQSLRPALDPEAGA